MASGAMPPPVVSTSGVKLPCSTSRMQRPYSAFSLSRGDDKVKKAEKTGRKMRLGEIP